MVKKIKVVEMNTSNPEAIEEQEANMQARDPTPTQEVAQPQESIAQDQEPAIIKEEEPKSKKPRQPREPRPPREPREPRQPREPRSARAPFVEGSVPTPRKEGGKTHHQVETRK